MTERISTSANSAVANTPDWYPGAQKTPALHSSCQANLLSAGPIAVETEAQPDGNVHGCDRPLLDSERIEDEEVAAMVLKPVADLHNPAVTFGRILAARNETGFLK